MTETLQHYLNHFETLGVETLIIQPENPNNPTNAWLILTAGAIKYLNPGTTPPTTAILDTSPETGLQLSVEGDASQVYTDLNKLLDHLKKNPFESFYETDTAANDIPLTDSELSKISGGKGGIPVATISYRQTHFNRQDSQTPNDPSQNPSHPQIQQQPTVDPSHAKKIDQSRLSSLTIESIQIMKESVSQLTQYEPINEIQGAKDLINSAFNAETQQFMRADTVKIEEQTYDKAAFETILEAVNEKNGLKRFFKKAKLYFRGLPKTGAFQTIKWQSPRKFKAFNATLTQIAKTATTVFNQTSPNSKQQFETQINQKLDRFRFSQNVTEVSRTEDLPHKLATLQALKDELTQKTDQDTHSVASYFGPKWIDQFGLDAKIETTQAEMKLLKEFNQQLILGNPLISKLPINERTQKWETLANTNKITQQVVREMKEWIKATEQYLSEQRSQKPKFKVKFKTQLKQMGFSRKKPKKEPVQPTRIGLTRGENGWVDLAIGHGNKQDDHINVRILRTNGMLKMIYKTVNNKKEKTVMLPNPFTLAGFENRSELGKTETVELPKEFSKIIKNLPNRLKAHVLTKHDESTWDNYKMLYKALNKMGTVLFELEQCNITSKGSDYSKRVESANTILSNIVLYDKAEKAADELIDLYVDTQLRLNNPKKKKFSKTYRKNLDRLQKGIRYLNYTHKLESKLIEKGLLEKTEVQPQPKNEPIQQENSSISIQLHRQDSLGEEFGETYTGAMFTSEPEVYRHFNIDDSNRKNLPDTVLKQIENLPNDTTRVEKLYTILANNAPTYELIIKLMESFTDEDLETSGAFRESAGAERMKDLQKTYFTPKPGDINIPNPIAKASLLKFAISRFEGMVIPEEFKAAFIKSLESSNQTEALIEAVKQLPKANQLFLLSLLEFFERLAQKQQEAKSKTGSNEYMDTGSVARMLGPNVFPMDLDPLTALQESGKINNVTKLLLEHRKQIEAAITN